MSRYSSGTLGDLGETPKSPSRVKKPKKYNGCTNVTKGKPCSHLVRDHDEYGKCTMPGCPCRELKYEGQMGRKKKT